MARIEFLTADWRSGIRGPDLVEVLQRFQSGPVYAVLVDTGTEDQVVALSDHPTSPAEAKAAWLSG